MVQNTEKGSGVPTLDAANLAYQFERVKINYPDLTDKESIIDTVEDEKNFPSDELDYLDDFYDKSTGTSGVAFRDKTTGEVIVAYTGTNPNVQGFDGKIEYAKDIKLASLIETNQRIWNEFFFYFLRMKSIMTNYGKIDI
ncbi:hypothetical protein [Streptococcus plurextorum]|uniref:hypothetical protein n=1 Tax=Streptococcus plurextorum TaxID=456876 RepID=UPI000418AF6F|nr:hypothetical protein [Streptococcus plurextorum]